MDTRSLREQIDELLASLDEHDDEEHQQADPDQITEQEEQSNQPVEIIDVYIVRHTVSPDAMADDAATVESTIEPVEQEEADRDSSDKDEILPQPHKPRRLRRLLPLVMGILSFLVMAGLITVALMQWFAPVATITIIPVSTTITSTTTVTLVSNNPDPTKHQLLGRLLSSVIISQAQTVATTGVSHIPAQLAQGTITFYNAAPVVQTVTAGTLLTGADGVQVVTDQDAVIPAVVYPTLGQATVSAHAVVPGGAGNIKAGDISGHCCRLDVFATNSTFHGGQDAHTTQTVAQQDIDKVTITLKSALAQSAQAALTPQVQPSETLVPPQCNTHVTTDHQVGEEATQVTVTVTETCTGEVYDIQAMHDLATQVSTQEATKQVGDNSILSGDPQMSITSVSVHSGAIILEVKITSTWLYEFSQTQQEQIKAQLAGKSQAEAKALLLQMQGVQSVEITVKHGTTLPTDQSHIHLMFLLYAGSL